ncbi:MAG TPA: type III polyketide synthase [Candidatus Limnocylindria bacterium]|nr:type III polyketide synthase [Candidatus Limnocylindria bacterium]
MPTRFLTRDDTLTQLPTLAGGPEGSARFRGMVERSRVDRRHIETPIEELLRLTPEGRSRIFEQRSRELAENLGGRALLAAGVNGCDLGVVVTVSCTGYMLPSVDAYVLPRLGVPPEARRVPVTELGCSAGVGGLGVATELLSGRAGYALVMSVELCSSCMQTTDLTPSDVIGNILFADAAAAAVVGPSGAARGPEILATGTSLWPETTDALGMRLSDTGLRLMLSPQLPELVALHLPKALDGFLAAHGVQRSDVAFWVIHPGGPRVLEAVGATLQLSERALAPSWAAWSAYGNVSSATVFFILEALRELDPVPAGRLGVMMAFGPGLSCELLLLRSGGWLCDSAAR